MAEEGHFAIPPMAVHPDGWGPPPSQTAELLADIDAPFAPFGRGDKLGRAADWIGGMYQPRGHQPSSSGNPAFSFSSNEEIESFTLVDTSKKPRPTRRNWNQPYQRRRYHQQQQQRRHPRGQQPTRSKRQRLSQRRWSGNRYNDQKRTYDASVVVKEEWTKVEQIDFAQLPKLSHLPDAIDDVLWCGNLQYLDVASVNRISTRHDPPLRPTERNFYDVTTSDDEVIRQLVMEGEGNVFATDEILALLMACTRSVYSWDLIIQRVGTKLFFDKRDGSGVEMLSVNETAYEPPHEDKEPINSPASLSEEATLINERFTQQFLLNAQRKPSKSFEKPNPFHSPGQGQCASVAYRYRKVKLADDIELVVRCQIDAIREPKTRASQQDLFVSMYALNEYDPKIIGGAGWRKKLDTQPGAVLATELKNNSFKMARWAARALLAGTDQLMLGYVSRTNFKDNNRHVVVGTKTYTPQEFASQVGISSENGFGVLKAIIEMLRDLPEGKYLLLKEPNKQLATLYEVPQDAFDDDDDEDDDYDSPPPDDDEDDQD